MFDFRKIHNFSDKLYDLSGGRDSELRVLLENFSRLTQTSMINFSIQLRLIDMEYTWDAG